MKNSINTQTKISILWIIVMLNMAYADILGLYIPGTLEELVAFAGGFSIAYIMLIAAIAHQIPVVMIFLSHVLNNKLNKYLNISAAVLMIIYVVGGGITLPHYIFLATIEVLCMLYIIKLAYSLKEK